MISLYLYSVRTKVLTTPLSAGSKTLSPLLHFKSHLRVASIFRRAFWFQINTLSLHRDFSHLRNRHIHLACCKQKRIEEFFKYR